MAGDCFRHASAVIAARGLGVVRRKCDLLKTLEVRVASFRTTHARREDLYEGIIAGTVEVPLEMQGILAFMNGLTHKGGATAGFSKF